MAIPELGSKQICPSCQAKFYDLRKRPAVCPKCQNAFDPDEAVRSRRTRVRAAPAERDELREDQVDKDAAGDEDEDEEDVSAPELDAVIDDPILAGDDDDEDAEPGAGPAAPDDELAGFSEGEEALDEEDADVPFLEDDDDDEFDESEIGLPGDDE